MKSFLWLLSVVFLSVSSPAQENRVELENSIDQIIFFLKLKPLEKPKEVDWNLYRLGEKLFFEKEISGNRNVSCASCHRVDRYSGDGLALGVGQGAVFGEAISLSGGGVLKRHTPVLINLGYENVNRMFWDGRLSRRSSGWVTPEEGLNGSEPAHPEIAKNLNSALATQSIFPMVSDIEMLGYPGDNEIADEVTNIKRWERIVARIVSPERSKKYQRSIKKAFSGTSMEDINISHLGNALAEYMTHFFSSYNTPYDEYLRGEKTALDVKSLRGMKVFFEKGRCALCHNGKQFTNFQFMSSGAPQIDRFGSETDFGRSEISLRPRDQFLFKTPQLRNVALTAPYMHSGSLKTLRDVVDHYDDIQTSLMEFSLSESLSTFYTSGVLKDTNIERNELRRLQVRFGPFLSGLGLTEEEKDDLVYFMEYGLTDPVFKKRLDAQGLKILH